MTSLENCVGGLKSDTSDKRPSEIGTASSPQKTLVSTLCYCFTSEIGTTSLQGTNIHWVQSVPCSEVHCKMRELQALARNLNRKLVFSHAHAHTHTLSLPSHSFFLSLPPSLSLSLSFPPFLSRLLALLKNTQILLLSTIILCTYIPH